MADDIQSLLKKNKKLAPTTPMSKQNIDKARKWVDRMGKRSSFEAESIKQSLGAK